MICIISKNRNSKKGSIALISLLIISAVTLMLVLGMSDTNISTAYQHANTQANKITYYAAEACIEEAMQRLEEDVSFTSTTLQLDSNTSCSVTVSGSGPYTIATTVTLLDYTQNYQATAEITASGEANNIDLQSWKKY